MFSEQYSVPIALQDTLALDQTSGLRDLLVSVLGHVGLSFLEGCWVHEP